MREDLWMYSRALDAMCRELRSTWQGRRAKRFESWVLENKPVFETVMQLAGFEKTYRHVLSQIDA